LVYGRGPKLRFNILSNEKFKSSVKTNFVEKGINQTLFELYIVFEVEITVSLPFKSTKIPVASEFLIAETVIVGTVPEAYTDIHRGFDDITESELDDINDFGAHL
jgi:hypothetical protein